MTGQLAVAGSQVTSGSFTVDLTSVKSDQSRRDGQFQHRIMDTSTYPTTTFALTQPIQLGSIPATGTTITAKATGNLTLHGVTRSIVVDVTAVRSGDTIKVNGSIPIVFADWNIPSPSFGPVTTDDHGIIEFLVAFNHA